MGPLRRGLATGVLALAITGLSTLPVAATPGAHLDPLLTAALASAPGSGTIQTVAVLDRLPTAADLTAITLTGATPVTFSALPMVAVQGTPGQIGAVAGLAHVGSMWLNHDLELALAQSVPLIQADAVHAQPLGYTGAGVGVAVLDSGIDGFHPDLHYPEHTIQNVKLLGYQKVFSDVTFSVEGVQNTDTTTGHGTHVAGIVAGTGAASGGSYTGVAPGANLIGLGAADGTDMLTALAGYDWILQHRVLYGIRVINNSWADATIAYDERDPLNQASKAAHDAGITVVFAAGNDGQASGNVYNRYAWPSWVIGVGGGTKLGTIDATYSSRGDETHHVQVVAPGSFIASARAVTGVVTDANSTPFDFTDPLAPRMVPPEQTPYYTVALGTSMAAPHVAGVVALMLEANPALTPDQIRALLEQSATPMPGCLVIDCGAGYVNALQAVRAALGALNQAPSASLTATPTSGAAPLTTTLDASGSSDPDGSITSYGWDLEGDGAVDQITASPVISHTYPAGVFRPTVTVVDDDGVTSMPAGGVVVRASDPPVAAVSAPGHGKSGQAVTFDASASWDPDGSIVIYRFTFGDGTSVEVGTPVVAHTYVVGHPTRFAWTVVVIDDAGLADGVGGSVKITP